MKAREIRDFIEAKPKGDGLNVPHDYWTAEIAAQLAERNERKQFLEFTSVDYNGMTAEKMLINREIIGTVFPSKHDVSAPLGTIKGKRECTAISVFGTEELIYVAEPYPDVVKMLGA